LRFATSTDDPWQIDADIIGRDFPAASSIPGALLVNTPAFATHVAKNALTLPVSAGGHFMGLGGDSPIQNMIGVITAVLWVVALFVCVLRAPRDALVLLSRSGRAITARSSVVALILTIAIAGAAVVSTFVIYPRPHYLVFIVAGSIVITGYLIDQLGNASLNRWLPVFAIVAVSAIAFMVNVASNLREESLTRPYAASLRLMNEQPTSWVLLTPERPIAIYLDDGEPVLDPELDVTSFGELLERNNITAVFDGILLRQAPYAQLDGFDAFREDPSSFGFQPILPNSPFLIRK